MPVMNTIFHSGYKYGLPSNTMSWVLELIVVRGIDVKRSYESCHWSTDPWLTYGTKPRTSLGF